MYILVNARKFGVLSCKFKLLIVYIETAYPQIGVGYDIRFRFFCGAVENLFIETFPILKIETAVKPRGDIQSDHTRFYRYRPRTAEQIGERAGFIPHREFDESRRESFFERRFADQTAIASPVKSVAGRVERYGNVVFKRGDFDFISRSAFVKFVYAVLFAKSFANRFFRYGLNRAVREEFTLHAFCAYYNLAVAVDIFFERYRFYTVEQIVESFCFETA